MKKKRTFTLLEIMIVIFLIGLIGSIIGYNMKGSLNEGKAFKTEQAILKVQDLLELELARGADPKEIEENPTNYLEASGIVKNAKSLLKDGWGGQLQIRVNARNEVTVASAKLKAFKKKKKELRGDYDDEDEEE